MENATILIFQLIVLLFSVVIHEVSHGLMAYRLGDNTAKNAGRLTLNPLKHLDFFGSFFIPLMLFFLRSPVVFGWAKPVPFNPFNLKNPKRDSGLIGLAGPLSNLSVAAVFGIILAILKSIDFSYFPISVFLDIIILINVVLGVFNLLPIPPLDGSRILFAFLPRGAEKYQLALEQFGFWILILFLLFGFQFITPIIIKIYHLFGGGLL